MYIYSLVTWKEAGGGLWDIIVYIVYNLWSTAYIVILLYPTLQKYPIYYQKIHRNNLGV